MVAAAPGSSSFLAGQAYAYGGVSPQECILPMVTVTLGTAQREVTITKAEWAGLRLRVEVDGGADLDVDLRLGRESSGPSLLPRTRPLDEHGRASLPVPDDHEGEPACLVVLGPDDAVLAKRQVIVGGERS